MKHDKFGFVLCSECGKGAGTLKKNDNGGMVHVNCNVAAVQRDNLAKLRKAAK